MSNEKPVRITVGDVKEVTEATTTQVEEARPSVTSPVTSSVAAAQGGSLLGGNAILGLLLGILLFIAAGYFAMTSKPPVDTRHEPAAITTSNNAPEASNAPAASNSEAASSSAANAPAATSPAEGNAPATNAPEANNASSSNPSGNNAPTDTNASAANH